MSILLGPIHHCPFNLTLQNSGFSPWMERLVRSYSISKLCWWILSNIFCNNLNFKVFPMLAASCIGLDFCINKVFGTLHISVFSCASFIFFSDLLSDLSCISLFQLPRRFLIFYCLALNLPNLSPGFSSHSNISSNCSLYFRHRFMYTDWVQVFTQSLTFSTVFL